MTIMEGVAAGVMTLLAIVGYFIQRSIASNAGDHERIQVTLHEIMEEVRLAHNRLTVLETRVVVEAERTKHCEPSD